MGRYYRDSVVLPKGVRNVMMIGFRYLFNKAESLEELQIIWKCVNVLFRNEVWLVKALEADKNRKKAELGGEVPKAEPLNPEQVLQMMEAE